MRSAIVLALCLVACAREAPPLPSIPSTPPPAPSASAPIAAPDVAAPPKASETPPIEKARVTAVELDLYNGCALYDDGRVACWDRFVPRDVEAKIVEGLPKIERIHVGFHFACALPRATEGEERGLYCWGSNEQGQLGRGKRSPREERPAKVTRGGKDLVIQDFLVGSSHACVLETNGDVSCFGSAVSGETGKKPAHDASGAWMTVASPNVVFRGAVRLYGGDQTSCAVDREERLFCWGGQDAGYNGHGDTAAPRLVKTPGKVRAMTFGSGHSCLLAEDGSVHCRGWNPGGQLGAAGRPQKELDGRGAFDADFEPSFVRIGELTGRYVSIAAARHETCAVSTEGDLTCIGTPDWAPRRTTTCTSFEVPAPPGYKPPQARAGSGSSSSLGPAPARFTQMRCVAKPMPGLTEVTAVASTMGRRCTLHRDGTVRCAGTRHHEGNPTIDREPTLLDLPN